MEHIEKFIDLFKGKLDEGSEQKLFYELAVDDELRADFKCFTSVTDIIKRSTDSFEPSNTVKKKVFASAGFAIPGAIAESSETGSGNTVSRKSSFVKGKSFSSLITGIVTTLTTVIIMLLLLKHGNVELDKNLIALSETNNLQKNVVPTIVSHESDQKPVLSENKPIIKYIYIYRDRENTVAENRFERISLAHSQFQNNAKFNAQNSGYQPYQDLNIQPLESLFSHPDEDLGISIEARSSANWHIPNETIFPASLNKFNNMDLSLFYKLSDNFRVGAEAEQETFYTEYTGKEIDGIYKYMQQPNFTTYSANLRWYPNAEYAFMPFVQVGIGFNNGGYVAKPVIGIEYQMYPNLSFLLGVEYNHFWFSHQNNWFTTTKAGINYGISYQF